MKKDEILNASRKEHQNKDLAEMEVLYLAGSHASRVGAFVCCCLLYTSPSQRDGLLSRMPSSA